MKRTRIRLERILLLPSLEVTLVYQTLLLFTGNFLFLCRILFSSSLTFFGISKMFAAYFGHIKLQIKIIKL